jgi:acyl-CoA thioester hydrolase
MARENFRFFFPFRVRYSEVDGQGVVFNAHYLTYYDTAITEYFRVLAFDLAADVKTTGVDFHVVRALVEYKAPILFDQQIDVGVRVARIGRSSVAFELGVFGKGQEKDAEKLYATGEIVWVYTHQTTHETVSVPEILREKIARLEQRAI